MCIRDSNVTLRVCGVVRLKESASIGLLNTGICYSEELMEEIIENSLSSQIVADQQASDKSVFTLQALTEEQKEQLLGLIQKMNALGLNSDEMLSKAQELYEDCLLYTSRCV